jgi:pimeloyl-ACP methyl ester carboxylesterase
LRDLKVALLLGQLKQEKMKKIVFNLLIIISLSSCQKEKITISSDAQDAFFLQEGGNALPIQVRGNTASKKMLVIVHGGPGGGGSILYRDNNVINNVEKEMAVAYWDQRFGGASQGNSSNSDVASFKNDIKKVLQLLKSRYGNDTKMYIMGHSWGGFLTPYFLEDGNNQDIVKGWIHVDGAHNYSKNDSLTKEMLLFYGKREIAANKNTATWQEIVNYCNAHAYNESFDVSTQLNSYAGQAEGYMSEVKAGASNLSIALEGANTNKFPITAQLANLYNSARVLKIDRKAYPIPISENLYKIKLPTLLLWGRYDFVCPIGLKADIKKNIRSTDVFEKTFEQSGHSPMFNEPEAFWGTVVNWVKTH